MQSRVLINDTIKGFLLNAAPAARQRLRKAFEYLENGLWEGGLRVKKLRGFPHKTVLEGRVSRNERLLLTLGHDYSDEGDRRLMVYVWGLVPHDEVDSRARLIVPHNAPFLSFSDYDSIELEGVELDRLDESCITQEPITARVAQESGSQRWFVLDDEQWKRLLLFSSGDFDIFLYLTPEQRELLRRPTPLLLSGTAGSGKTTLGIYYLLSSYYRDRSRLFVTYNRHLRNFAERLYRNLVRLTELEGVRPPDFRTFRDVCLDIVPEAQNRFSPEAEVDLPVFQEMLRRGRSGDRYDAALVWEEIRSIIKGAKPQLDARVLRRLTESVDAGADDPPILSALREELLALRNFGFFDKAQDVARRTVNLTLSQLAGDLPKQIEKRRPLVVRTLLSLQDVIGRHEANFAAPLMTYAEYETLGRKRAPAFVQDRKGIYAIAEWYQSRLQAERLWDEIDLTRAAIRALDQGKAVKPSWSLVCCDEVQDLTDIQLSLLVRLPGDPARLLLAGDPKQIVNPSGFRWEEAKDLFYDRGIVVPPVHHLTLNFRCVGSIVLLANALLQLKQHLLGVRSDERLDDWKFQGRPACLVEGLAPDRLLEHLGVTAADRAILTRTVSERDDLKERLGTELVFTIREAKGLEFRTVVLWNFCGSPEARDLWARIGAGETARLHDHQIRHEINLLYVGITRAQQDLVMYDGPEASPVWNSPLLSDHIYRSRTLEFLDETWRATSSPEDWVRQGDYFLEHEHYRAAAECYRNGGRNDLRARAQALVHEKKKELESAARCWLEAGEERRAAAGFEKASLPGEAFPIWERLGEKKRAAACRTLHLEATNRFEEAATLREAAREWAEAAGDWTRTGRHDRAALLLVKLKRLPEAARAYRAARDFDNAARLFLKLKDQESAARSLEDAGRWVEAAAIWAKADRPVDRERCLVRSGNGMMLGEFYEERCDWDRAAAAYRPALTEEVKARWEEALSRGTARRAVQGQRALRFQLLGRPLEAASAWESAKETARAAAAYSQAHDFLSAARCYEKVGQDVEAIAMYARSPEDRKSESANLNRCFRRLSGRVLKSFELVEALARSLKREQEYLAAAAVFKVLNRSAEAADCLDLAGELDEAFLLWMYDGRSETILRRATETGRYSAGATALQQLLSWRRPESRDYRRHTQNLAGLLDRWWKTDQSEETRLEVSKAMGNCLPECTIEFIADVMVPLGRFDPVYGSTLSRLNRMKTAKEKTAAQEDWAALALGFECGGNQAVAGLWYLCAGRSTDAQRCWGELKADDGKVHCLKAAGMAHKVARMYLDSGRPQGAEDVFRDLGGFREGARVFEEAGMHDRAGSLFEAGRLYEDAHRAFIRCGAQRDAARMLERLKRFAEAAALFQRANDLKGYRRCARKAGTVVQATLPGLGRE